LKAGWTVAMCQATRRMARITREITQGGCVAVFITERC
jgi:hypothetical protein